MAWATARHILVKTKEKCEELKKEIDGGADFKTLAMENSDCPSGVSGGSLGKFSPGQMVREFDQVVFSGDVGVVYAPVVTQFGFHIIEITGRG
ncbi:MAG: peptidyl-prolyl cis-trans isomerase [Sulfurimonas sp.]|nr:peptidyl-prolyl cis-trans isomerase [Sulfurimonas sp.]